VNDDHAIVAGLLTGRVPLRVARDVPVASIADRRTRYLFAVLLSIRELGCEPTQKRVLHVMDRLGCPMTEAEFVVFRGEGTG
jgi:hypothetical protein